MGQAYQKNCVYLGCVSVSSVSPGLRVCVVTMATLCGMYQCVSVCVCVCASVCLQVMCVHTYIVCVCVREREREICTWEWINVG